MASIANPSRDLYWCHQCAAEMTPMMVPDPMCSNCQSEFVEKIDEDNDPRTFAEPEPEDDDDDEHEAREHLSLDDLFRLFQVISNPPPHMRVDRTGQQPQRRQQQQQQQQQQPGEFPMGGHPILFNPFQVGSRTESGTGSRPTQNTDEDEDVDMENTAQEDRPEGPMIPGPPMSLAELLGRLSTGLMSDGTAGGFGGGLFNLPGNPGDYVFSQGGLDDVISQMMEMQSRSGPVGASDEVINSIPQHKITPEELDAKTECSVCQDKFTEQDVCLQLKCKHIFHDDCIKPWLKTSATCPTCRCSLIPDDETARRPPQDSAESSVSSSPNLPGSFPNASGNNRGQNSSDNHSSRSMMDSEDLD
ncbi:E3 ubiquitin-protein ligase RNF115/126 [Entomortierella parvispora]|uniref:RING-type E3 ubiquitin transferase n=1 Tax=Entomortierella parvispora TaxID=205924 RepID=A0A9P3H703_9FUNG|nr:E3 ubiquitin-protein ligase RNF115/126 [Entomortierella parvispora]